MTESMQIGSDTEQNAPVRHSHPKWPEMITQAIEALDKGKKGSSIKPIKDYIVGNYDVGDKDHLIDSTLKRKMRECLENGVLEKATGVGLSGSFRVVKQKPVKQAKKPKATASDEKSKTSVKSPKAASAKSPKVTKKSAAGVKKAAKKQKEEHEATSSDEEEQKPAKVKKGAKTTKAATVKSPKATKKNIKKAEAPVTTSLDEEEQKPAKSKKAAPTKVAKKNAKAVEKPVATSSDEEQKPAKNKKTAAAKVTKKAAAGAKKEPGADEKPKKWALAKATSNIVTPKAKKQQPAKKKVAKTTSEDTPKLPLKRTKALSDNDSPAAQKKARKN